MILLAALPLAIWIYLLLGRGFFWRIPTFRPSAAVAPDTHRIAVVIPARDEASSIGRVIESWRTQRYDGPLCVFLVDDHSSDGTSEIARLAIEGSSSRFRLLSAPEKPADWTGKLWAVALGVEAAREFSPDYILFTDADIVHSPDTLRALVARAVGGYDLVSLMVRLNCETLAERSLIPAFVFFFFLLYPPRWIRSPRSRTAGAAGGCMLLRRNLLEKAGGIQAIRNALIDDCALAAAVKRAGGRVLLMAAESSDSLRVYPDFSEIGRMISRTAFTQLQYSLLLLAGTLAGLLVTYLLPVAFTIFAGGVPRLEGIAAWFLMSIAYFPSVRYYRISPIWSLALPAIAIFYSGATMYSAVQYWRGRGGEWKGRTL
ncbi:MAG TPA: glycosyltransferase [Bryobacteraceae bacterium]|jgi:hopene-associated glycosyltransferase HpnB